MIAEVGNTFGERLPELLHGPELHYAHDKHLHVSPFFGLDQSYEYAFSQPGDEVWARIHVHDKAGGTPMTAVLHGRRRELTNASLARTLLRYPLQPLQVTALIHWQAFRLWLKRVPFHHKPPFVPARARPARDPFRRSRGAFSRAWHRPCPERRPVGLRGFHVDRVIALVVDTFVSHNLAPVTTRRGRAERTE